MRRRDLIKNGLIFSTLSSLPGIFPSCGQPGKRNSEPAENKFPKAGLAMEEYEKRRSILLENTAGRNITPEIIMNPDKDIYSNQAIANLLLDRFVPEANKRIRHTAAWFEHPHPHGRDQKGECDFAAIKLCRAYWHFRNSSILEKETRESIEKFFLQQDFQSMYGSENHELMFRVSRFLMAALLSGKTFLAYGKTGEVLETEDRQWLKDFIRFRARQGWGEFDSSGYYATDLEILLTLYDYAGDQELKKLTGMMMNLLMADIAVDSMEGMYCGAHGRIYPPSALDHFNESIFPFQYLYFGNISHEKIAEKGTFADPLISDFRPDPLIVELALDREEPYENFERKHLHNMLDIKPEHPLNKSIRKYTFFTPQYVMGCVQFQDRYPEGSATWYAFHEQHNWDLSFSGSTRARIFTHHPGKKGNEHNYWTGDLNCGCGHFFQNKNALICLYDIPEKEPYQFIHAYLPAGEFDEISESDGFLFVRRGDTYAALKLLGGHLPTATGEWKDMEIISMGRKNGAICEAGNKAGYNSFENFRSKFSSSRVDFDPEQMKLTYKSVNSGKLTINTQGLRELDDQQVSLDYPAFGSPYMKSDWDSGVIRIFKNGEERVLDFRTT